MGDAGDNQTGAVIVRTYAPADQAGVVALWRVCDLVVPANDPERDIARKLAWQPGLFLVAERTGALVGSCMAGYEGHRGWINYLAVAPDSRRLGIGRMLVAEAEERLRAYGCPKINLNVRHSNTGVMAFYRRLGYAEDAVAGMGKRLIDDAVGALDPVPAPPPDIAIRPHRADDAEALFEAASSSHETIYPWLPWCHPNYAIEESRAWLARCEVEMAARTEHNFAIVSGGGRLVGGCGLNGINAAHRSANLGYWVRSDATGRGVATEAVRQLAAYAWSETDLERLEIVAAVGNLASRRVAEKSGAIPEGIAHRRLCLHGRMHDAAVYALVRPTRSA
jgi:RimJ/RimL family protein N-acetyltransferase